MNWLKNKINSLIFWVKRLFSKTDSATSTGSNSSNEEVSFVTKMIDSNIPVVVMVIALNWVMFFLGHVMAIAAIVGIAAVISFLFVLMGMDTDMRKKTITVVAKFGWHIDLLLTALLTYVGFHISVTMGMTAIVIGLNLSGVVAMCRMIKRYIYDRNERKAARASQLSYA